MRARHEQQQDKKEGTLMYIREKMFKYIENFQNKREINQLTRRTIFRRDICIAISRCRQELRLREDGRRMERMDSLRLCKISIEIRP